ncbi:hypothetical protein [Bacteroides sp. 3_1_13]|nr:hypothetical protein [Bacteroides sp. 3_1_13]MDC2312689.1 hypothetical protein [Bacteroides thetaiotaomicron]
MASKGIKGLFFYQRNGNRHLGTRYPIVSSAKHHRRRNFICHPIEIR